MQPKSILLFAITLIIFSCSQNQDNSKLLEVPNIVKSNKPDSILATWISHGTYSSQMLELIDSSNALVYWYRVDSQQLNNKPYFFKGVGTVTQWDKIRLTVYTDKYNFHYNIWNDTLILRDEAGIIEKLVRVTNDTIGRNELK